MVQEANRFHIQAMSAKFLYGCGEVRMAKGTSAEAGNNDISEVRTVQACPITSFSILNVLAHHSAYVMGPSGRNVIWFYNLLYNFHETGQDRL